MENRTEKLKEHFQDRWSSLKGHRDSWMDVWKDLGEHFMPEASIIEEDPKSAAGRSGSDKQTEIVDGTGISAVDMLASGMQSGLTSPTNKWFELSTGDDELDTKYNVKKWLFDTEMKMLGAFAKSNFYNVAYNKYGELATFGTSADVMVYDPDTIINCVQYTPGTYCLGANYRGFVDSIYREWAMTAKQMVEQFGYDRCSSGVQDNYDKSNTETLFNVMHIIEPNTMIEDFKNDNTNFPFISAYYESECDEKKFLRLSGYKEQPFFAPRWKTSCNNVYGTSPARNALGHVKMLQALQKDLLRGIAKQAQPPMVATSDVKRGGANVMPKGITYVDSGKDGFFKAAFQVNFDLNSLNNKIMQVQDEIRKFFYNDLFLMQAYTSKRQTAYETEVKEGEKLRMLSPVIERLQYEYLDLVIDRCFGIMSRKGLFDQPPSELAGKELKVHYIGTLSRAQRMLNAENIGRVFAFAGQFAGINPSVVDNLDFDTALRLYRDDVGGNPRILKDERSVDETRQQRAKMQAQQIQQAQQMQNVEGAKLMSETDVGEDNILGQIMEGI